MQVEIYRGEEDYFVCRGSSVVALRWYRDGEHWACAKETLPSGVEKVEVEDLPGDLQEELLAFMARAEMMGNQIWSSQN